jgi:hypothetical protein
MPSSTSIITGETILSETGVLPKSDRAWLGLTRFPLHNIVNHMGMNPEGQSETGLPKLRVRLPSDHEAQDVYSIEEARYRFNWGRDPFLIVVEGRHVSSFDELLDLVRQERFKGRPFLDVEIQPLLAGG